MAKRRTTSNLKNAETTLRLITGNPAPDAPPEGDFAYIRGQEAVKRAITVALAGGHPVVLWGPAGEGKTLLADAASDVAGDRGELFIYREVTCGSHEGLPAEQKRLRHLARWGADEGSGQVIHVNVPPVPFRELSAKRFGTPSSVVKDQVSRAKAFAKTRKPLAQGWQSELSDGCLLLLKQAHSELGLTAQAVVAIVHIARTIANMDESPEIQEVHLAEAIQYRIFDRL